MPREEPRRGDAVLHRLESAQHRRPRSRHSARLQAERVRALPLDNDERVAGETEEGIYQALGMAWVEPELREHRGEIEAAVAGSLPQLVTVGDLRGDLHMHTTATDGKDDLETMAAAAHRLGLEYIAITDHSQALAMANGLDERARSSTRPASAR